MRLPQEITFIYFSCMLQLDKLYDPNAPEDDQMERYEEMNRMREHVIKEIDKNDDRMVSLDEFIASTKKASFEKDEGWEVCPGSLAPGRTKTHNDILPSLTHHCRTGRRMGNMSDVYCLALFLYIYNDFPLY